MPNNKRKSVKDIDMDKIHPHSRKAAQVIRANQRQIRLAHHKQARQAHTTARIDRFLWFKYAMGEATRLTKSQIVDLVDMYVRRNDEDLERMAGERRPGRGADPKIVLMKAARDCDLKEVQTGFCTLFLNWFLLL
jgi:hypothetical protein